MGNNNIKLDISGMVKQVDDLNKAMEQLGILAQGVFSTLGRSADTFSGKMNSAQQAMPTGGGVGDMLTRSGQGAVSDFQETVDRGRRASEILQRGIDSPNSPFFTMQQSQDSNILQRSSSGSGQVKVSGTGFTKSSLLSAIEAGEMAQLNAPRTQSNAESTPSFSQNNTTRPAFGYGAKDVVRFANDEGKIQGLSQNLTTLSNQLSSSNKEVGQALNMVQGDLQNQFSQFKSQLQTFSSAAPGTDAQKEAMNELTQAMKRLDRTLDDATEAEKQARNLAGGGGGGGSKDKTDFMDLFRRFGPAALSTVGTIGSAYFATNVGLRQATAGKEFDLYQSQSGIAQQSYQMALEAADMTKADNLLRYRGDQLFPGQFDFLGGKGMSRAMTKAGGLQQQRIDLEHAERNAELFGNGLQGVLGAAGIVGGVALGGPLGLLAGLAGGQQLISGVTGGIRNYYTNPSTIADGGLTSFMGRGLGSMVGLTEKDLQFAQDAALSKRDRDKFVEMRALQDLEIQRNPDKMAGLQESLDRIGAQNSAAGIVGRYAPSSRQFDRSNVSSFFTASQMKIHEAQTQLDYLSQKEEQIRGTSIDATLQSNLSPFSPTPENKARMNLATKLAQKKIEAVQAFENAKLGDGALKAPLSPYAALGMTAGEFMMSQAQLTNVLGGGESASIGQTSKLLGISKGGFGSFDQLTGGLAALNRASGGQDSTQKLEQILATAFGAGFDKSRMAQQFVATTTELSRSLGVTSPESLSRGLAFSASAMTVSGRADELSLSQAAKGMSELAQFTGQTGGAVGSLKVMGAYGAGVGFGSGTGIIGGSNTEQLADYERQLSSGKITDARLDNIVRLSGGKTQAMQAIRGAMSGANAPLRSGLEMVLQQNKGLAQKYGANSVDDLIAKGKGLTGKARSEFIRDFMALTGESGTVMGVSEEAGMAFGGQVLQAEGGFSSTSDKAAFNKAVEQGKAKAINPALVNLRQYLDTVYAKTRSGMDANKVGVPEYMDYLSKGHGDARSMDFEGKSVTLDEATIKSKQSEAARGDTDAQKFLSKAESEIGKMDRLDMAMRAQYNASSMMGDQRVVVTNLSEIAYWMKNLNSTTEKN